MNNNPVRYTDPTGHSVDCAFGEHGCSAGKLTLDKSFIGSKDKPKIESIADKGWSCSPTALCDVLHYYNNDITLEDILSEVSSYPPLEGGLDPAFESHSCPDNPVCTSLSVIEKVARKYAEENDLKIKVGENWTKDDIMRMISNGIPVMVNYGGGTRGGVGHSVVFYGYDLNVDGANGGTFYALNPIGGSTTKYSWNTEFKDKWADSDFHDPTRQGAQHGYYNWALALYH